MPEPTGKPGLILNWSHLAVLNFEVDPMVLSGHVPPGTKLDLWEGSALVSCVGMLHGSSRWRAFPLPLPRGSEEIHLRFYVRREFGGQQRRGIAVIRGIVPRALLAWITRRYCSWNYSSRRMRHHRRRETDTTDPIHRMRYEWLHEGEWNRITIRSQGSPALPRPGSLEEFLLDRRWGYARRRGESTVELHMAHPTWRVWQAARARLVCSAGSLFGPEFVRPLAVPPASAFFAEGSQVRIHPPRPL